MASFINDITSETGTAQFFSNLPPVPLVSILSVVKRWSTLDYFGPVQASLAKEAALHLANHTEATELKALSNM